MEVPIFTGRGVAERVARARLEERELALLRDAKRADLELEGQRAGAAVRDAERIAELASQELAYARENLDVLLAQFEEGRIHLAETGESAGAGVQCVGRTDRVTLRTCQGETRGCLFRGRHPRCAW